MVVTPFNTIVPAETFVIVVTVSYTGLAENMGEKVLIDYAFQSWTKTSCPFTLILKNSSEAVTGVLIDVNNAFVKYTLPLVNVVVLTVVNVGLLVTHAPLVDET